MDYIHCLLLQGNCASSLKVIKSLPERVKCTLTHMSQTTGACHTQYMPHMFCASLTHFCEAVCPAELINVFRDSLRLSWKQGTSSFNEPLTGGCKWHESHLRMHWCCGCLSVGHCTSVPWNHGPISLSLVFISQRLQCPILMLMSLPEDGFTFVDSLGAGRSFALTLYSPMPRAMQEVRWWGWRNYFLL